MNLINSVFPQSLLSPQIQEKKKGGTPVSFFAKRIKKEDQGGIYHNKGTYAGKGSSLDRPINNRKYYCLECKQAN